MNVHDPHIITDDEIKAIQALGYSIVDQKIPLKEFLLTNFPGIKLYEFLTSIDGVLAPISKAAIDRQLWYDETPPPTFLLVVRSTDWTDNDSGLAIMRTFIKHEEELVVKHDFFRLPIAARNMGIGKQILRTSLQQYERMGVNRIFVDAALEDGGYVWAKAGFNAVNRNEVDVILEMAMRRLTDRQLFFFRRIYDRYYNVHPHGKAFPMDKWSKIDGMDAILKGSYWSGEMNLNNTEVLANFKGYVA